MQKVIILGFTGSVGSSAARVLRFAPEEFDLVAFSYHNNFSEAQKLQREFQVKQLCCTGELTAEQRSYWQKQQVEVTDSMLELLDVDYDSILTAVVGSIGVRATFKAAGQGKKIMLANKESLVMAGQFLLDEAQKNNAAIVPVDSEHNSVFRLLASEEPDAIKKIILTASGGPLRTYSAEQIRNVKKADVLDHPTWSMGQKITVDSAGMINKALEIIEAHHLFSYNFDRLDAVIHQQSLVHAIIEFNDGTFSFHVSTPDMAYPVAHSLYYPHQPARIVEGQSVAQMNTMNFEAVDKNKFPGFFLGLQAGQAGQTATTVFNAANEVAVQHFLADGIKFHQISESIARALDANQQSAQSLDDLFEIDRWAREYVSEKNASSQV